MGLNDTPSSNRIHIAFFGRRNAGKSSLVNAITRQSVSLVSDTPGTTTDPVVKSMELGELGPVVIIDTAGIDDEGSLGEMRISKTRDILRKTDIAVLVTDAKTAISQWENELIAEFKAKGTPYIVVANKSDLYGESESYLSVSAKDGLGIEELKKSIISLKPEEKQIRLVSDFINKGDTVLFVTPIDESAPKGRLILPQQQAIRDVLDMGGVSIVVQPSEIENVLGRITPDLVVTDSQVFSEVNKLVPCDIPLTSFSILMARLKGLLGSAVKGALALDTLKDGDKVLISEGCTHHRQCKDIGTYKLPKLIKKHTGAEIGFEFTSGGAFAENLSDYALIVHCGGCMLNDKEMQSRVNEAKRQGVPITNYGTAIAHMNGILRRSIQIIYQ